MTVTQTRGTSVDAKEKKMYIYIKNDLQVALAQVVG